MKLGWQNLCFCLCVFLALPSAYAQQNDVENFVELLLPVGGRDKRVVFLPSSVWGKKKPPYRHFFWQRFDSQHFRFYTYPTAADTLPIAVAMFEEYYDANSELFGVDGQFDRKIPIIFYPTREDFEQTHTISGLISESLGGVTEPFSWKRVILPFEGELSKLEHVVRHEGTHIYQVASNPNLPLWFIEGSAETNSIYWDANAELILRDGYLHDKIPSIDNLWQIQGTWLMYKTGNFITNYIVDHYGKKAIRDIFIQSRTHLFSKAVKLALGISLDQLNEEIRHELNSRYGHLSKMSTTPDLEKEAEHLDKAFLVAGFGKNYLSGKVNRRGRLQLVLNRYENNFGQVSAEVVVDRHLGTESLHQFQSGGDLNDNTILYTVKVDRNDAIRRHTFTYDNKKRRLAVSKGEQFRWAELDHITDPTIIDDNQFAFIGITNSRAHIYSYNTITKNLTDLTPDNRQFIAGLDYSPQSHNLVFAKELGKTALPCDYNYDLFTLNLTTRAEIRLTATDYDEKNPRFSADGTRLLFTIDKEQTFNQAILTLATNEYRQITTAKIGIGKAEWRGDQEVYLASPNEFMPHIYLSAIAQRQMLTTPTNTTLVTVPQLTAAPPLPPPQPTAVPIEVPLGPMRIRNGRLELPNNPGMQIDSIATIDQDLYVAGKKVDAAMNDVDKEKTTQQFFKLGTPIIQPIGPQNPLPPTIAPELEAIVKKTLQGRTIMQSFISPDQRFALVRTNNVLSLPNKDQKPPADSSLLAVEFQNGATPLLHEINDTNFLKNLRFKIQELQFLADNHALMVLNRQDVKNPRLRLGIASFDKKNIEWPFGKVVEYSVSEDGRRVAARGPDNKLLMYDLSSHKTTVIANKPNLIPAPSMGFTHSGALAFITRGKSQYQLDFYDVQDGTNKQPRHAVAFTIPSHYRVLNGAFTATFSQDLFTFALHCLDLKSPNKSEALFLFDAKSQQLKEISTPATRFRNLFFADTADGATLFYEAKTASAENYQPMWATLNKQGRFLSIASAAMDKDKAGGNLIFEGDNTLYRLQMTTLRLDTIAEQTFGFVIDDGQLIYSRFEKTNFKLFKSQGPDKETLLLAEPNVDLVRPRLIAKQLYVEKIDHPTMLPPPDNAAPFAMSNKYPIVEGELSKNFRLRQLAAAAAFDGERFRYFLTAYADNLFSDQSLYVNSILFSDQLIATVGFLDHNTGYGVAANFSDLEEVRTAGIVFHKSYLLDEFREIKFYNEFELQDYPAFSPQSPNFLSDPANTSIYYVGKFGIAYGMDETVWDRHGPFAGKRFYVRTEAGIDLESGNLANIDANLDLRLYHAFWPRVGLAHRVMAGISRGDIPTRFLLGGNISFRGVGFDNLEGNQYWVVNEDIRLPLFDIIGAKLPDPVDNVLGFLTRYFDVRGGIYGDVGAVWLEDAPYETVYSFGYFFNIPTIFRLTLRFNQGIIGERGVDIWLGYNW